MAKFNSIYPLSILLIFLGLIMLLDNFGILPGIYKFWPFLTLFLGGGFIMLYNQRKRKNPIFIGVGAYLILSSILFFYCNFLGWKTLITLWPSFIGFGGVTLLFVYIYKRSRAVLFIGLLLIIICATFFFVFTISPKLWPVSLILFGLSLFALKRYNKK